MNLKELKEHLDKMSDEELEHEAQVYIDFSTWDPHYKVFDIALNNLSFKESTFIAEGVVIDHEYEVRKFKSKTGFTPDEWLECHPKNIRERFPFVLSEALFLSSNR